MASKFEIVLSATIDKKKTKDQVKTVIEQIEKDTSINLNTSKSSSSVNSLNKSLNELKSSAKGASEHTQSLGDSIAKFTQWQIVGDIVHGVKDALSDMVDQVFELDNSLVELSKVTDLTEAGLEALTEDAYNVGQQIGATATDVIDATTIFAQAGYEAQDALDLSEQALILTNVSEAGASVTDSANTLIAAMKAFNIEGEDSSHIVDALNEVNIQASRYRNVA